MSLSGCRSLSAGIRLVKAVQDHGIGIFISPPTHLSTGLSGASWLSGSLGKVGCGVSVAFVFVRSVLSSWNGIPLSHENGSCSLSIFEAPVSRSHFLGTPSCSGASFEGHFPILYFLLWRCCKELMQMINCGAQKDRQHWSEFPDLPHFYVKTQIQRG